MVNDGACFLLRRAERNPMARPKQIEGEKTAYERIEDAFWDMLEEMPYHKMTGKEICTRAKVSHNSFYYHFDNMDDMAQKLFDRMIVPEIPAMFLSAFGAGNRIFESIERIPDCEKRFSRMCLLAGSGSPFLIALVRDAVMDAWFQAVGINERDLTVEDRIDLIFICGGAFAVLSSGMASFDSEALRTFPEREVGHGVMEKMTTLAQRPMTQAAEPQ